MSLRVRLTAEAVHNQNEIADWIGNHSIDGALRWLDALERMLQQISTSPLSFPKAPEDEFCRKELRNALFGTPKGRVFRAIFYVEDDTVIVTHVRGPDQRTLPDDQLRDL